MLDFENKMDVKYAFLLFSEGFSLEKLQHYSKFWRIASLC